MEDVGGVAHGGGYVVGYHDHRHPLTVEVGDHTVHFGHSHGVKSRNGLVQQDQISRGTKGPRQKNSLLLSTRKLPIAFSPDAVNAHTDHGRLSHPLVGDAPKGIHALLFQATRPHDLPHRGGKIPLGRGVLGQIAHSPSASLGVNGQFSSPHGVKSQHGLEEGALSRAVLSNDAQVATCLQGKIYPRGHHPRVVGEGQIFTSDQ